MIVRLIIDYRVHNTLHHWSSSETTFSFNKLTNALACLLKHTHISFKSCNFLSLNLCVDMFNDCDCVECIIFCRWFVHLREHCMLDIVEVQKSLLTANPSKCVLRNTQNELFLTENARRNFPKKTGKFDLYENLKEREREKEINWKVLDLTRFFALCFSLSLRKKYNKGWQKRFVKFLPCHTYTRHCFALLVLFCFICHQIFY